MLTVRNLGSPTAEVTRKGICNLEYHDEKLSVLKLPPQQDHDAVMAHHPGGTFGDKTAILDRFRTNYQELFQSIKPGLVLENNDVSWSAHNLLSFCKELNIPSTSTSTTITPSLNLRKSAKAQKTLWRCFRE